MYQNLFKPTYLQALCQECGLNPSKKYGQNYLITDAPVKKMIEAAEINKKDIVIEIGPGFGILTFPLVAKAKKIIAFEIEKKLENYWERKLQDLKTKRLEDSIGEIEIVWGNALYNLKSDVLSLPSNYKVVANLPYQITSNILRVLLELENKPESITVMVQKEVADRICAKPGDMSILAVSVQYFGEPKIITKVPKGCFWPSPRVDSAVLHIKTRNLENQKTKKQADDLFFKVVRAGFMNKRKQLWRNLSESLKIDKKKVQTLLGEITGNELIRAEELSVEQWTNLVKKLYTQ